jgi:beta-galactosidase
VGIPYEPGELKAIGYRDGEKSVEFTIRTPGPPESLRIDVDFAGTDLQCDGADAVFLHAHVVDANGTLVPDAAPEVEFTIDGPAALIGNIHVNGGVASTLLKANFQPGEVRIIAKSPGLSTASRTICIELPEQFCALA